MRTSAICMFTTYSMDAFQFGTLAIPDATVTQGETIAPGGFDMKLTGLWIFMR